MWHRNEHGESGKVEMTAGKREPRFKSFFRGFQAIAAPFGHGPRETALKRRSNCRE
ncbi:hypothetical protein PC116_g5649 [Phytophthora cactorum]|uniref:Uncharacterized protein n=1 Tax=Phytophthora cactorum TaxID=29920 RepID=A0A8T1D8Z6_9STRA|nr:hypothetical protein Pcac1_g26920 [Phytophthora cactorum]KAG3108611.1 hypothetical protein PI125_g11672 [Phytophthora idaei]KAG2902573.1 hypothetical protein PC114_g12677 [Phytophthora cactorum]KAG2936108.1 hypothetical protein PC117_g12214 [Phytophthora cactorum]KAG3013842.1 hypothetical protein PC119_g12354 [Phytophthora cactorum]